MSHDIVFELSCPDAQQCEAVSFFFLIESVLLWRKALYVRYVGLPGEQLSASADKDDLQNGCIVTLECLKESEKTPQLYHFYFTATKSCGNRPNL